MSTPARRLLEEVQTLTDELRVHLYEAPRRHGSGDELVTAVARMVEVYSARVARTLATFTGEPTSTRER